MVHKRRLDSELVKRGLAKSRQEAVDLIMQGTVKVAGVIATKSASQVDEGVSIMLTDSQQKSWASRGAYKLLGALEAFTPAGLSIQDKIILDAGASHGGFTDVLVEYGAQEILAVDVGYGQLAWHLRNNERVKVYDRTNIRYCTAADFGIAADLIVCDLSFISVKLVLPAFLACLSSDGQLLPMVKPQFEVGKNLVGKNGIVKSPQIRLQAIQEVAEEAATLGAKLLDAIASPLPGQNGNVEYFLWLQATGISHDLSEESREKLEYAVKNGPQ